MTVRSFSKMRSRVGLIMFVSFVAVPGPADAYLDPGTVSLTIQAIVAALAGAALTWKGWYWRLRSLLRRARKRKRSADDAGRSPRAPGDADAPSGE